MGTSFTYWRSTGALSAGPSSVTVAVYHRRPRRSETRPAARVLRTQATSP
jgi:hypothetical protein